MPHSRPSCTLRKCARVVEKVRGPSLGGSPEKSGRGVGAENCILNTPGRCQLDPSCRAQGRLESRLARVVGGVRAPTWRGGAVTAVRGWQGERTSLGSDPSRPHVDAKGPVFRSSEMRRSVYMDVAGRTGSSSSCSTDQDAAGTANEIHTTSPGPSSPTLRAPAHPTTGAATRMVRAGMDAESSPLKGQFSMREEHLFQKVRRLWTDPTHFEQVPQTPTPKP